MYWPSLTLILSGLFVAYILNGIWSVVQLFYPPQCAKGEVCLHSYLNNQPQLQLLLLTSIKDYPRKITDLNLLAHWTDFDYHQSFEKTIEVPLPPATRRNGTLHLHVYLAPLHETKASDWKSILSDSHMVYLSHPLTQMHLPEAQAFQLLSGNDDSNLPEKKPERKSGPDWRTPQSHFRSRLILQIVTEKLQLPAMLPADLAHLVRITSSRQILPLIFFDTLSNRIQDLRPINSTDEKTTLDLLYAPASVGKHRLWKQFEVSLSTLSKFGFTEKDVDEVKGIFTNTNLVLLCITFFVAAVHLLLDFLAFKNDVLFWKSRKTTVGVSTRTLLWRAFSQFVICFYLLDEKSSLLVLGPAFVGALIEVWKVSRAFRVSLHLEGFVPRIRFGAASEDEQNTHQYDAESMRYLAYLLYPLCAVGAVYSLLYVPHRSWYSWAVQSMANGVYAFGFLFMLPQLFVNYKLKSVAHLPWRAFMYKAFNTFIDDLFAFIIVMPTAHRVACFRDDVVFVIYLYQRWLYPVDHKRVDAETQHISGPDSKKEK